MLLQISPAQCGHVTAFSQVHADSALPFQSRQRHCHAMPPEEYPLPNSSGDKAMIRGIHHIGIHVHDMERMIRFYQEAFGFELVGEPFGWEKEPLLDQIVDLPNSVARGAMLRSGTVYFEIFQYSAPGPDVTKPLRASDKGYTHMCIDTTDIAADFPKLEAAGMTFKGRDFVDMGHVKTLYGYDPEGNLIEIQQCMPGNGMTLEDLAIDHSSP
jgi:glyoxylase I family protein